MVNAFKSLILLLTVLAAVGSSPAHADLPDGTADGVDAYLKAYADDYNIPGLAVAVVDREGPQYERFAGEDGDGKAITGSTPFMIGSVSKPITATVVMQLIEDGKFDLDDRVKDRLPWLGDADPTVRQLLTHTSGYSAFDGLRVASRADNGTQAVTRAAKDLERSGKAGTYAYSSANYLVLGAFVEAVTKKPYAAVVTSEVFGPLGMTETAATADAARTLPPGNRLWFGHPRSFDEEFDASGTPYASVVSTLNDLSIFARDQLTGGPDLDDKTRAEMQSPQVSSGEGRSYGLGWRITNSGGNRLVHHTGANPGYFTHVMLVPEKGIAVVLLTNAYSETRALALASGAEDIVAILDGREPTAQSSDPLLSAIPWITVGIAALGLLAAARAARRPSHRRLRLVAAAGSALLVAVLWLIPRTMGYDLPTLMLWLPDAATAAIFGMVIWTLAALLFMARRPARVNARTP